MLVNKPFLQSGASHLMCIAIPSRITAIDDMNAVIDVMGASREINLMLLPEEVQIGDFVLVHAGFAIRRLDPADGEESLRLFRQIAELGNLGE
jgi:hydrogenase expression/formation protein HypC